jgi:hypothetical protein
MAYPRHPASDGNYHEIPDVADQVAVEAEDQRVESYGSAPLDYSNAEIPNVSGETAEHADTIDESFAQYDSDQENH